MTVEYRRDVARPFGKADDEPEETPIAKLRRILKAAEPVPPQPPTLRERLGLGKPFVPRTLREKILGPQEEPKK